MARWQSIPHLCEIRFLQMRKHLVSLLLKLLVYIAFFLQFEKMKKKIAYPSNERDNHSTIYTRKNKNMYFLFPDFALPLYLFQHQIHNLLQAANKRIWKYFLKNHMGLMFIVLFMMFYLKIQAKLINGSKLKRWTTVFLPNDKFSFHFFSWELAKISHCHPEIFDPPLQC